MCRSPWRVYPRATTDRNAYAPRYDETGSQPLKDTVRAPQKTAKNAHRSVGVVSGVSRPVSLQPASQAPRAQTTHLVLQRGPTHPWLAKIRNQLAVSTTKPLSRLSRNTWITNNYDARETLLAMPPNLIIFVLPASEQPATVKSPSSRAPD